MSRVVDLDRLRALAAEHAGRTGSQVDLARLVGCDKSHVTRLKQLGQLVMTADGFVDLPASLLRIADHADPARGAQRDVAARRREEAGVGETASDAANGAPSGLPTNYADARATREHWQAQTARVEYERLVGGLVPRAAVERAVADAALLFRQAVDNQPHRLADRLVGLEHDAIRARLREDGQLMLAELSRNFDHRLALVDGGTALASDTAPESAT